MFIKDSGSTLSPVPGSFANQDLDFCLGLFADDSVKDLVHSSLEETESWEIRKRCLPSILVVWLILMLALQRNVSIVNVFLKIVIGARHRLTGLPIPQGTGSDALCHARSRLGYKPMVALFRKTASNVESVKSFAGMGAWVIDGTTCDVPDTDANVEYFSRPETSRGRAGFPQLKMVPLVCAATRRIKAVRAFSCRYSEKTALLGLLPHIPEGDVLLVDRGLASYSLCLECRKLGVHVVQRVSSGYNPKVLKKLGTGDYLVEGKFTVPIPENERTGRRKHREIKVRCRMIVFWFQHKKDPVRLLTTLPVKVMSAQELAVGYHTRWEVELAFDELKTHLATVCHGTLRTPFRSKSPQLIFQEIYALLAVYNLIRSAMVDAAEVHALNPLHISFVGTVEILRSTIPYLLLASSSDWPVFRKQLLKDIAAHTIKYPRRSMWYPRKVKKKMSNYGVKGEEDVGFRCDFLETIQLCELNFASSEA